MRKQGISNPVKNRVGRPTKYNTVLLDKAQHYLEYYEEYDDIIPSVAGLALALEVSKKTLYSWAADEDKQEFLHVLDNIILKKNRFY